MLEFDLKQKPFHLSTIVKTYLGLWQLILEQELTCYHIVDFRIIPKQKNQKLQNGT